MTLSVRITVLNRSFPSLIFHLNRHGVGGRDRIVRRALLLCCPTPHSIAVVHSEITPEGRKATKLGQTLLNGNNICIVSGIVIVLMFMLMILLQVSSRKLRP